MPFYKSLPVTAGLVDTVASIQSIAIRTIHHSDQRKACGLELSLQYDMGNPHANSNNGRALIGEGHFLAPRLF